MEKCLTKLRKNKLRKRYSKNDTPTKKLKENSEVFARYLQKNINFVLRTRFSHLI